MNTVMSREAHATERKHAPDELGGLACPPTEEGANSRASVDGNVERGAVR